MYERCRCGQEISTRSGSHVVVRKVIRTETDVEGSIVEDVAHAGMYCSEECAAGSLLGQPPRDPYADSVIR